MKETHYKLKHRVTALFAAAVMLCSMLPGAAFAEEPTPQPTEETVQMEQQTEPSETDNGQTDESSPDPGEDVTEATPETAEEQPAEEEIPAAVVGAELYTDLPNAPIGSYIGSEGLPVATGETKIGISEWPESQLEETSGSYLTAAALDNDGLTMAAPLLDGADYAIVPIMVQVEYPADGSTLDLVLPDSVTLLDYYGAPAADAESLLHSEYSETSAAVLGVYVQADANFTAQLVYTAPDGSALTKTLNVAIDRNATAEYPFPDSEIAAFAERPTPAVTSGKITKVAKVNGTWLIWFNGEPAYCCTPGADGQPKNCPTYTYVNTSMVGADQYVPGDHYGNQFRIWGGLTQLSLGMQELPPVALSAEAPSLLDFCRTIYTDAQMQIIENYPDSTAAKILIGSAQTLLEGTDAYASARGYYTYIYQPGRAGWQTVAVIGPEISDDEPNPKPIVQEIYANWEAPAQTASGSFDFDYGIITNKVQLKTNEKVDGATIEIEPITKSGTIDGGTWAISPADKQTVTTSGHTDDNNYQNNGGAASASWTLHYSVSKTTDSRSGRVGPYTTQDEADAAADSARDAAIAELQGEAQRMVDNAVASAKAELANVKFRYEEVGVPYGFEMYWGSNGSNQTISVPANSNNAYLMKNDEWSLQVNIKKTDSETGNQIAADAQYEIFQWDTVTGKYQPTGGYNTYSVQRQGDGTYAVINSAAYATTDSMRHTLYYTQRNAGKFIIVETKAPTGYFGDWTDINHPGMANTPLGKRGYYIEITEDSDNSVIWLDNADYNADIAATDKGGTKLVTRTGVETTVTIYDTAKDPSRTYNTDNSGKAANEDSYTITPTDGVMKNDRTLGEISISKVDLDAVRYVGGSAAHGIGLVHIGAAGQMAGAALQGRELNGTALAVQVVVDEIGKVPAGAAEDGLVAKGIQLPGGGDQIAQIGAVGGLDALAGRDDDVGLHPLQLVHLGEELVRLEGDFRQKDEVGAVAVVAACEAGRTGQPSGVTAHDLGHSHATDVVDGGVTDDFLEDGGDVLGRRAVAGGVVGEAEVIIDGLGYTDKTHRTAYLCAVAAELGDGVHRVVAADVEHRADVVLVKQGEQLDERGGIGVRVGQLEAAAAQIAGRSTLEQLDAHAVVQQNVELQQLFLEQTLDAVLHAVHLVCTQTAGSFVYACKAGVDHGGRAAALTNDDILGHGNLLQII
mgnify:CR=1 FL=1